MTSQPPLKPASSAREQGAANERTDAITEDDLYTLPEGTLLYKPKMSGWMLFIHDKGWWRVVDAYEQDRRGKRYSPAAVGCHSPGYVVWQAPAIGYYTRPDESSGVAS